MTGDYRPTYCQECRRAREVVDVDPDGCATNYGGQEVEFTAVRLECGHTQEWGSHAVGSSPDGHPGVEPGRLVPFIPQHDLYPPF